MQKQAEIKNEVRSQAQLTLAARILKVIADVGPVEKDGFNTFSKYHYVTETGVLNAVRDACVKYGLCIVPDVVEVERYDVLTGSGKAAEATRVIVEFTLINADDNADSLKVRFPGYAQDTSDKSVYKAMTGATKYFFLKTFLIGSADDDPENDHGDVQRVPGKAQNTRQASKAATPAPVPAPPSQVVKTELDDLIRELRAYGISNANIQNRMKELTGVEKRVDLNAGQIVTCVESFEDWANELDARKRGEAQ